ncbi:hypothetical protein [Sodalis-like endosymbiont of Proechinophthirus fluctus]
MVKNPTSYFIMVNKMLEEGQQTLKIDMVSPFTSEAILYKK